MGARNDDPYEQRLFAVFKSCLTEGQTELEEADLLSLCNKLHLDEKGDELKLHIRKHVPEKRSVSFQEFRDGLLALLKTQGLTPHSDGEFTIVSQRNSHANGETVKRSRSSPPMSAAAAAAAANRTYNLDNHDRKGDISQNESRVIKNDSEESSTLPFISDCLGIPVLPKEIIRRIFERVDGDCDGLIDLEEFLAVFQGKRNESESNDREEFETVDEDIRWNVPTTGNTDLSGQTSLLSDLSLADLTSVLCDELKNLHDSLSDRTSFRSHLMLLRAVLILYQEELRSLSSLVDNLSSEKEKLRADVVEANERANSLAQEVDEYHIRQEEVKRNLLKQIEQRHSESIRELSNQLCSERESNTIALKSKDDQLQASQKDNHEIKNKLVNSLQENLYLETENQKLRNHVQQLRWSNNELLAQIKDLAAEHEDVLDAEAKQQEEVIHLLERIKQLQSETMLLRDQNDELAVEMEALKSRDFHLKDVKEATQTSQTFENSSRSLREVCDELTPTLDGERNSHLDLEFQGHSDSNPFPCSFSEDESDTSKTFDSNVNLKTSSIIKELKNILSRSNRCNSDSCTLKNQISAMLNESQSTSYNSVASTLHSKQTDFSRSIASELETECEMRTSGSLRDFVVCKSGSSNKSSIGKRAASTTDNTEDISIQDAKNGSQSKTSSLRDYPPRKEEQQQLNVSINDRDSKEKEGSPNKTIASSSSNLSRNENEDSIVLEERDAKQLAERCMELEQSLHLMRVEYEECEDYWAGKLEEERQLFEQEQKMSDEKLSELIAKIAEYEELISPADKLKNGGRLSPIEEKYKLEQQYSDLEEEFEKWKVQMQKSISEKDSEIEELKEKLKSLEKSVNTSDFSIQVSDEVGLVQASESTDCIRFNNPFDVSSSLSIQPFVSSNEPILKMARYSLPNPFDFEASTVSKETKDLPISQFNEFAPEPKRGQVQELQKLRDDKSAPLDRHNIKEAGETTFGNDEMNVFLKEETKCDFGECKIMKGINDFKRNDTHRHVCVDFNILQSMNMKLQAQERKKRQLQEYFRHQQDRIERVLRHILTQHQMEVSGLQCLLRDTQEKLQVQIRTSVEQAEKLARADVLIKDLYIENTCLMANMKSLEQRYHILTGFNAESTSI